MYNLCSVINYQNLDKLAISNGVQSLTYKELNSLVGNYAHYLSSIDLKNKKIFLDISNPVEFIAAYLGVLKSGNISVLINSNLSQDKKTQILSDLDIDYTLSSKMFQEINDISMVERDSRDPCTIIFTSGSIKSKGVIVPHNLKINVKRTISPRGTKSLKLISSPFYHLNGLFNCLSSLANGGTLFTAEKFSINSFETFIDLYAINDIVCVPTVINMLNNDKMFDTVKLVRLTSAPTSYATFQKAKKIFPNATIRLGYGLTEVGSSLFGNHPSLPTPETSVGYPLSDIEYRLINNVLEIKSPSMLIAYTDLDKSKITEDGFFVTNDLFEIDKDGFYYFTGRADDMFACGGVKIYPLEIEKILEQYDGVETAVVIKVQDKIKGFKPYAFIKSQHTISQLDLENYVRSKMPFSHCPRKIWVVKDFPYNSIGKIDKLSLTKEAEKYIC
jgi:long-chain acyl-CoA synthetase